MIDIFDMGFTEALLTGLLEIGSFMILIKIARKV